MIEGDNKLEARGRNCSGAYWLLVGMCVVTIPLTAFMVSFGIDTIRRQATMLRLNLPVVTTFYLSLGQARMVALALVGGIVVAAMGFLRRRLASVLVCGLVLLAHILIMAGALLAVSFTLRSIVGPQ